jgi:predicted phage terminase large subunit-like protein
MLPPESLNSRSLDELQSMLDRVNHLRDLHARKVVVDRADFLTRYPTPGVFAQHMVPRTRQTPALEAIDSALVEWTKAPDDRGRLMVFCPPQEGKSTKISGWTPLWRLAADPTLRIAIVSYAANKAERWGRWLRRMIEGHPELGITLMPDSRAAERFETTAGGRVICVGMEGGITGEPVDDLYVDDPLRGRAEAESPTYRERAWEWWESNGATRLSARGRVVLMLTRWHADDLAGRLLKEEPGEWTMLRIPALRHPELSVVRGNDGASVYSPDGELISVQARRPDYFRELKVKRSGYVWRSVYDQDPVAAEGNLFSRPDFRYWTPLPPNRERHDRVGGARLLLPDTGTTIYLDDCWRFLTVDLAGKAKTSADYTVASVWAHTGDGTLILLDRIRQRLEEGNHWTAIQPLTRRWAAEDVFVERGFIGTTMVIDATRANMRIQPLDPDADKVTRAIPATHRVAAHMVWFPASAPWLDEWCDELAGFPTWAHDDQVDTFSYAVRVSAAKWNPYSKIVHPSATAEPPRVDPISDAFQAMTGTDQMGVIDY